ncbi:MAG: class I SAM-dependent methyltransferase [Flavobacteriales bacterium]|nr:class I SAM-dependent methyltransferase [Flavobacteriales bacterium]MCB9197264.1 class I SAM-dependent methyltransferase [Flavobacteriales bacterium]
MKEFWNSRYSESNYVYGETPNLFFKEQLDKLKPGKILLPAEGEGRNAVYAAQSGWTVTAFDQSEAGKTKALALADKNNVSIIYDVKTLDEINYQKESFDVIGLIYVHFPQPLRKIYHQKLSKLLKPNGTLILEGFEKSHIQFNSINPKAGGPKEESMLFSLDEIKSDFTEFDIEILYNEQIQLNEGDYHVGESAILRFVGRKK